MCLIVLMNLLGGGGVAKGFQGKCDNLAQIYFIVQGEAKHRESPNI